MPSVSVLFDKNTWALPLPVFEPEASAGPSILNDRPDNQLTIANNSPSFADEGLVKVSNNHALDYATGENRGCPPALYAGGGEEETTNYGNFISLISGQGLKQWVSVEQSDLPVIGEGKILDVEIATNDVPINHNSHDIVWKIALDHPEYSHLAPDFQVSKDNQRQLKIEWEIKNFYDPGVWPFEGDRAWVLGRWIFDCGHVEPGESDGSILGQGGGGFKTEIHPPQAVAFSRNEPFIFSGNNGPSDSVKTFVFINGKGGYYNSNVGGENGNYAFDIDLPPKPSPDAVLRTQILFPKGGLVPTMTAISDVDDGKSYCHTSQINTGPCTKVHVFIPYSSIPSSEENQYSAIVVAGWDEGHINNSQAYREVQVTFDSVEIIKCVDCSDKESKDDTSNSGSSCSSTDNRIMLGAVNGKYKIISGYGVQSDLLSACEGQKIDLNISFPPIIVREDGSIKIRTSGYERNSIDDYLGCGNSRQLYDHAGEPHCLGVGLSLLNENTKLCDLKVDLTSAENFGIKYSSDGGLLHQYTSCSNADDEVKLTYHVEEIQKY